MTKYRDDYRWRRMSAFPALDDLGSFDTCGNCGEPMGETYTQGKGSRVCEACQGIAGFGSNFRQHSPSPSPAQIREAAARLKAHACAALILDGAGEVEGEVGEEYRWLDTLEPPA